MSAALRSFIGSSCPSCSSDILQSAPPRARMPPGDFLWCPACESEHTLSQLAASSSRGGFFRRIFAKGDGHRA